MSVVTLVAMPTQTITHNVYRSLTIRFYCLKYYLLEYFIKFSIFNFEITIGKTSKFTCATLTKIQTSQWVELKKRNIPPSQLYTVCYASRTHFNIKVTFSESKQQNATSVDNWRQIKWKRARDWDRVRIRVENETVKKADKKKEKQCYQKPRSNLYFIRWQHFNRNSIQPFTLSLSLVRRTL